LSKDKERRDGSRVFQGGQHPPRFGSLIQGKHDVEKANTLSVYWLGYTVGGLARALRSSHPTLESVMPAASFVCDNISIFGGELQLLPLSQTAAQGVVLKVQRWFHERLERLNAPDELTSEEISELEGFVHDFQAIFLSELPQANIFHVTPKLAYDVATLIDKGECLLPESVLNGLAASKDKVFSDVREAARCVALNIPTGAGFHIFRAIEAIVVDEYFPLHKLTLPKNRNLGAYTKALKEVPVDAKVTTMLDYVREQFRNPISHPEQFWSQEEAVIALGLAVSAITMMVQDINKTDVVATP